MRNYSKLKVAAVQAESVFIDINACVDKACEYIRMAKEQGAKLIAFPEGFLLGYPYWCWIDDPISTMPFTQQLFTQAIECPGPELSKIATCAKENSIYVCIGATEREQSSVYDTQFWFDDNGNLLGKHRKLKPMHSEKMIWGEGDASTMEVYDTPLGRMGSLLSCEHMNPMNSMLMCSQREEIHVASYPAVPKGVSDYREYDANMTLANCYAVSNACYLLFSTQIIGERTLEIITADHPEYKDRLITAKTNGIGGGNACIMNPDGEIISNLLDENEEGIVTADIDLAAIGIANFFGDTAGHYCNTAVHLKVENERKSIVRYTGKKENYSMSFETIMKGDK